jgi:hypothetical protein
MADETEKTVFDEVTALAEKLTFASDSKKAEWINDHMKAAGWTPTTTWSPPSGDSGKGGGSGKGGWFK